MTHEEFAERITAMQGTLYRVSATVLNQPCDREDAVQSCIEKAWRKQAYLRNESRLQAWVVRILLNECYTMLRKRKRETPVESMPEVPAPKDANPDLYRFFTSLPDKLRVPMALFYIEGYSVEEIAHMQRLPLGTVKSRLCRGREAMRRDEFLKEAWEQ